MESFLKLGLSESVVSGLKKQDIINPTEIQRLSIPYILKGENVIGESYTGSGKTLAFICPLFDRINISSKDIQVLILAPTYELVMQIDSQIKTLSENSNMDIVSLPIIGEVNIERQIKSLKAIKPHIIVGTPGRVFDLIKKKKIKAHNIKTIVIDEADNLLSNTNSKVVKDIIKSTMRDRKIVVFSATIDNKTLDRAKDIIESPKIIKSLEKGSLNPNIHHMYIEVDSRDKIETLRKLLFALNANKVLVFINRGHEGNIVTEKLKHHNIKALGVHGKSTKEERQKAIRDFREGKINVLISSDVSARGIDIDDITHIINLDFPANSGEYLHRVGRTARAGKRGDAISLVTSKEKAAIRVYEREFKIKLEKKSVSHGKLI